MDKIPFYPNIEDFDNNDIFNDNYHPESFDLLNYYKIFEDNENKAYVEKNEDKDPGPDNLIDFGYQYDGLENSSDNYSKI
ncbi:hypothetical protein [Anaerobranca gottschalkii]|uniref:Uncharacterized protein n=1 Tax=Anaerobranca gottschalkii DSM 13577 TaxID=1120990 RepID=A0A1I0CTB2_9FIRM|nr:hypothetical protein [Anaerobranca gottschalkii]SET23028.1 hypothetical protein SAMN03080614_10933 [Anaerobranca gottschalkii DSM 13577]